MIYSCQAPNSHPSRVASHLFSFLPPKPLPTAKTDHLETTFGPEWLKWTFNLEPESLPSPLQPSVLMFHFSGIAHGLLAPKHEISCWAVTLKLPITSPLLALGRDLLLASLEPQYKLSREQPSFQTPEILG